MHDARDPVDVDAARGDVGGDEHVDLAARERVEGALTLTLRAVAVDRGGLHPALLELLGQRLGAVLGAAEHDRRAGRASDVGGHLDAIVLVDLPEQVREHRHVGLGQTVHDRVVLVLAHQRVDRTVERGREEERLAIGRREVEQGAHLGQEAHVGHAVGLVDHDELHRVELELLALEQVLQPTGAGDEHVDALPERRQLLAEAGTAVDRSDAQLARATEPLELTAHLRGQLAGGHEDQTARLARLGLLDQDRERHAERDRLARARGGAAAEVASRERVGDGHFLDGERGLDAARVKGADDVGGHAEIGELVGHGLDDSVVVAPHVGTWWSDRLTRVDEPRDADPEIRSCERAR